MKRIQQEHRTGCGIACVAMLSGTTYAQALDIAKEILFLDKSVRTFYTSSAQLQKLLLAMNVPAQKGRSVRKWTSISDTAIVAINHNIKNDSWHWVVFRREQNTEYVLDPQSKREVRTDFDCMRLRSFIPIDLTIHSTRTC